MAKKAVRKASPKQQKAAQQKAFMQAVKKRKPFEMPQTDKKLVVSMGWDSAYAGRLSKQFPEKEWHEIRVDMSETANPDIVSSLAHIEPLPDASVDGVWIGHVLQRATFSDAQKIIQEALRIMKDNAIILAAVPDMQLGATYIARGEVEQELYHAPAGPVTPADMIFGFRKFIEKGDNSRIHRSGYTAETLPNMMRSLGICNMQVRRQQYDILALGRKLPYGHPDRVDRIVINTEKAERPKAPNAPAVQSTGNQPVRYKDKLETEPQLWKPLGLKKKKK